MVEECDADKEGDVDDVRVDSCEHVTVRDGVIVGVVL